MFPCFLRVFLLFGGWGSVALSMVQAQKTNYPADLAFFRRKVPEFSHWLKANRLERIFRADSVSVTQNKVTLYLRPAYTGARVCDSIQCAWNQLEKNNQAQFGQPFRERLLHKWAFLAEVPEVDAQVIVRCHEPAHFLVTINSKQGKIPADGRSVRSAAVVSVPVPPNLGGVNVGENQATIHGGKVNAVCAKAKQFLVKHYQGKGTPVLWKARVDDSYAFWDEFVIEVTHLSNEIISDNYFEYHRVYLKGIQKGEDVELSWEFQGKYGSGIIFPPRKNDYKDLETRYKSNVEEYQKKLFKKLIDYLRP